jgi:transcriptional regulator with XRE-family HTH domain
MEAKDVAVSFFEGVRRLMASQSPPWTQRELARRLAMSEANISRALSEQRGPNADTLARFATVFGVDVCELLCKEPTAPKKSKPTTYEFDVVGDKVQPRIAIAAPPKPAKRVKVNGKKK